MMTFGTLADASISDDTWPIIAMVVFTAFSIWFKRRKDLTAEPAEQYEREEPVLEMAEFDDVDRVREAMLKRIEEREKARARALEAAAKPEPVISKPAPVRVILEEAIEHGPAIGSVHQKLHGAKGAREAFKMAVVLERYSR